MKVLCTFTHNNQKAYKHCFWSLPRSPCSIQLVRLLFAKRRNSEWTNMVLHSLFCNHKSCKNYYRAVSDFLQWKQLKHNEKKFICWNINVTTFKNWKRKEKTIVKNVLMTTFSFYIFSRPLFTEVQLINPSRAALVPVLPLSPENSQNNISNAPHPADIHPAYRIPYMQLLHTLHSATSPQSSLHGELVEMKFICLT